MTDERTRLLLYLESCAVDHGGLVDVTKLTDPDMFQAIAWNEGGLIGFGRVKLTEPPDGIPTHWVELSERCWAMAHRLRKETAERAIRDRTWEKDDTEE